MNKTRTALLLILASSLMVASVACQSQKSKSEITKTDNKTTGAGKGTGSTGKSTGGTGGFASADEDTDGDGISNDEDVCPTYYDESNHCDGFFNSGNNGGGNSGGGSTGGGSTGGGSSGGGTGTADADFYEYAYVQYDQGPATSPAGNIYWADTKGTPPKKLTHFNQQGSGFVAFMGNSLYWTPDGKSILYSLMSGGSPALYKLDVAGAKSSPVTAIPSINSAWGVYQGMTALPLWAAIHPTQDKAVAVTAESPSSGCGLRRTKQDGTASTKIVIGDLFNPKQTYSFVALSPTPNASDPSYEKVIYGVKESGSGKQFDLWIVPLSGTQDDTVNLTKTAANGEIEAAFSPDGKKVAFTESVPIPNPPPNTPEAKSQVKVCDLLIPDAADVSTAKLQNCSVISSNDTYARSPSWTCDGHKIFFTQFQPMSSQNPGQLALKGQIILSNADGSGKVQVTDVNANAWSPVANPKCP